MSFKLDRCSFLASTAGVIALHLSLCKRPPIKCTCA